MRPRSEDEGGYRGGVASGLLVLAVRGQSSRGRRPARALERRAGGVRPRTEESMGCMRGCAMVVEDDRGP